MKKSPSRNSCGKAVIHNGCWLRSQAQTPSSQSLLKCCWPTSLERPSSNVCRELAPSVSSQTSPCLLVCVDTEIQPWPRTRGLANSRAGCWQLGECEWNTSTWKTDQCFPACPWLPERNAPQAKLWGWMYCKWYKIIVRLKSQDKNITAQSSCPDSWKCARMLENFILFTAPAPASSPAGQGEEKQGWTELRYSLSPEGIFGDYAFSGRAADSVLQVRLPSWHQTSPLGWVTGAVLPKGDSLITASRPPPLWSGCKTAHSWDWDAQGIEWVKYLRAVYLGTKSTLFLCTCLHSHQVFPQQIIWFIRIVSGPHALSTTSMDQVMEQDTRGAGSSQGTANWDLPRLERACTRLSGLRHSWTKQLAWNLQGWDKMDLFYREARKSACMYLLSLIIASPETFVSVKSQFSFCKMEIPLHCLPAHGIWSCW